MATWDQLVRQWRMTFHRPVPYKHFSPLHGTMHKKGEKIVLEKFTLDDTKGLITTIDMKLFFLKKKININSLIQSHTTSIIKVKTKQIHIK